MKPDSPTEENVANEEEVSMSGLGGTLSGLMNLGGLTMNPSVIINNEDGSVEPDFEMDEEVMNFMHGHIHSKPDKHAAGEVDDNSTRNTVTQSDSMNGLSWDAPLRTARESALAPDDYNENEHNPQRSDFIIEADLQTEREDLLEEDSPTELAKRLESELTGSILALWQQRLTQSTSFEGEIEIEYAESDINSSGPPSPSSDDPSVLPHPDLVNHNFGNTDRNGNRATTKLPMPSSSEGTNATLEEMRSKLRKTKFDYNTDTKVRISEATPLLDYRSVLKKKGNV